MPNVCRQMQRALQMWLLHSVARPGEPAVDSWSSLVSSVTPSIDHEPAEFLGDSEKPFKTIYHVLTISVWSGSQNKVCTIIENLMRETPNHWPSRENAQWTFSHPSHHNSPLCFRGACPWHAMQVSPIGWLDATVFLKDTTHWLRCVWMARSN